MGRKRNKTHLCFSVFLFFAFSICTIFSSTVAVLDTKSCPMLGKADTHFQKRERQSEEEKGDGRREVGVGRRLVGGPGSTPPRCTSKCGNCTPCRPVHVPLPFPPATPVTAEYYPEAWRCKCGNNLYIP